MKNIIFAPNSLKITYEELDGTMFIETQTAKDLELTSNNVNGNNGLSIFSKLDWLNIVELFH